MTRYLDMAGQFLLYAAFAGAIAVFSRWPVYHQLGADEALIKLSIVHEGKRLKPCVLRTPAELAKLPPNMRAQSACPRERAPIVVEVDLDGEPAVRRSRPASGLARDGRAAIYQRLVTTAGTLHGPEDARRPTGCALLSLCSGTQRWFILSPLLAPCHRRCHQRPGFAGVCGRDPHFNPPAPAGPPHSSPAVAGPACEPTRAA